MHRAGSAGSTVAGAAARKVTGRGKKTASEDGEGPGVEGDGERWDEDEVEKEARAGKVGRGEKGDSAGEPGVEHRVTMKRLMVGVRGHRNGGWGRVAGQEHVLLRHAHRSGYRTNGNGVSAPSVQAKPKGGSEGPADGGSSG